MDKLLLFLSPQVNSLFQFHDTDLFHDIEFAKFLIFFKDGAKVLTNSRDNTLKIVDLRTYDVEQTLQYAMFLFVSTFFPINLLM